MTDANETPCLVETARGVSVLYNNRHLFSRFDPTKAFLSVLNSTAILDESLVICFSPVLDFPIMAIFEKLQTEKRKDCFVLAIEKDKALYNFFHKNIDNTFLDKNFSSVLIQNENDISLLLDGFKISSELRGSSIPNVSNFRRVIVLESSSEVNVHRDFYSNVVRFTQNSISQFWKNRMTLVRLGKLFSKNTLHNVSKLKINNLIQKESIEKPLLVVGAGTSLDANLSFIKKNNENLYVLAIGAAVQTLISYGINIDAIVSLEGQYATDKAYIGLNDRTIPLFADIASRPNAQKCFNTVSFFISEYTKSSLLDRIKKTFPNIPVFPPLGSVGITATELALFLRKNEEVPVFFVGLDFSFPIGQTHAKESPHIKEALQSCTKLSPIGNVAMSFRHGTFLFNNSNETLVSDSGLKVYADLFNERYKNIKNVFNLSNYGMVSPSFYCATEKAVQILSAYSSQRTSTIKVKNDDNTKAVDIFYKQEKERLETIKNMLTGAIGLNEEKLLGLLEDCSYLYEHFPDGHKGPVLRQDFLNRVRGEVDVFLKQLTITM